MKKLFLGLVIVAIAFTSCTKDRVDEPKKKTETKTYYFSVIALEKSGATYSSKVVAVQTNQ